MNPGGTLRLRIDELPADGLTVDLDGDLAWAVTAVSQALEGPVRSLEGSLRVLPVGEGVSVRGFASVEVLRGCDRCLTELRHRIEGEVDLWFDSARLEGDTNVNLHEDELDVGFLDDGVLDLGAALGEFFVLEAPARLRCGDPSAARTEPGPCTLPVAPSADEPRVDPRFAALKNFRSD
jgi:uncharacterized metal-binding protein YceD (DUF177 family)